MFKVPDWGNDIPKGDGELIKLFGKKSNTKNGKSNAQAKVRNNNKNQQSNLKNKNGIKKAKNRVNGKIKLSTDDHINNRILKRNLKIAPTYTHNNHITENAGNTKPKHKTVHNKMDVNNRMKSKILKRKGNISNHGLNEESIDSKKVYSSTITSKKEFSVIGKNRIGRKAQSRKRKQATNGDERKKRNDDLEINNADLQSLNTDEPDKIIVNAKRKKLNDKIKNEDIEDVLFGTTNDNTEVEIPTKNSKLQRKKEKLKEMLKKSNRNVIRTNCNKLRQRMLERLKAAQFRYLNEKLYTSSGSESQELFKSDPVAFQTYHEGYQLQVKKWPVNPLDIIVKRIQKMPKTHLIADMGCGEAALSKRVPQTVRSFDLVATAPGVEACNMAHTPLLTASMDVVVFCLALMGTDLTQYLLEANRVLKIGGHLLIAEVESRFDNVDTFSSDVQRLGFSLKKVDKSHQVFFFMEFNKVRDAPAKKGKLPTLTLKPCLYKRR